jgi:hypothetical protein
MNQQIETCTCLNISSIKFCMINLIHVIVAVPCGIKFLATQVQKQYMLFVVLANEMECSTLAYRRSFAWNVVYFRFNLQTLSPQLGLL